MTRCDHNCQTHDYATTLPGRVLRIDAVCDACGDTLWSTLQPAEEAA